MEVFNSYYSFMMLYMMLETAEDQISNIIVTVF